VEARIPRSIHSALAYLADVVIELFLGLGNYLLDTSRVYTPVGDEALER
jgi:hypothetical protein